MVKFKNGLTDLTNIELVLTDFGMAEADSRGGTPIFASPECFEKKDKKSDIFSFGRVILFLLLPKNRFVKWLFVPVKDVVQKQTLQTLISNDRDHSINLISKMTTLNDRISVQEVREQFNKLKVLSKISLEPVWIYAIDSVVNAEISDNNEDYVAELCDFRYEAKRKAKHGINRTAPLQLLRNK